MKHKLRKSLAVGIICLLMLVSIPMVSGEDIRYSREEGPYNIFIGGYGGLFNGSINIYRHPLKLISDGYVISCFSPFTKNIVKHLKL